MWRRQGGCLAQSFIVVSTELSEADITRHLSNNKNDAYNVENSFIQFLCNIIISMRPYQLNIAINLSYVRFHNSNTTNQCEISARERHMKMMKRHREGVGGAVKNGQKASHNLWMLRYNDILFTNTRYVNRYILLSLRYRDTFQRYCKLQFTK